MKDYYTVKEVAEQFGVHWQSILTYIKNGELEAVKIGRGYQISEMAMSDFIKRRTIRGRKK